MSRLKAATSNTVAGLQFERDLQYAAAYDTVADLQYSRDLQYNRRFTSVAGVESAPVEQANYLESV